MNANRAKSGGSFSWVGREGKGGGWTHRLTDLVRWMWTSWVLMTSLDDEIRCSWSCSAPAQCTCLHSGIQVTHTHTHIQALSFLLLSSKDYSPPCSIIGLFNMWSSQFATTKLHILLACLFLPMQLHGPLHCTYFGSEVVFERLINFCSPSASKETSPSVWKRMW